jgi:hypothetical protein
VISVIDPNTFGYTMLAAPATTPATGSTITASPAPTPFLFNCAIKPDQNPSNPTSCN